MGIFGPGPHDEDSDDRAINRSRPSSKKTLCLKKYKTKDAKGNTVTRTCIKKAGHWGAHK
jgi:hypothetical protein